jgi:cobalt-zinc-cadmium efflux system outer membrane protein
MFRKYFVLLLLAVSCAAAQEASTSAPANAGVTSPVLTLDDVVREVLARNPAIAGAQQTINAQRRSVSQAGALPDPTLTASYMGDAVPFKTMNLDPSSYRGITAMQMLPLGGKRGLRREMARTDVSASEADKTATSRRLTTEAKAAFYDYYYYGKALDITNRDKARLEQLAEISEARYRVGKAMQQDVLRAHLEVTMLLQRAVTLEQQRDTSAARLNTLMDRPIDSPLPPAAEITKQLLPAISTLAPAAEAGDPELEKERATVERNKVAINLAKKDYTPDLSVGYMYQQRSGQPDMYGMAFTVNVPIFYKSKRREAVEQAKLELSAAEQSREARKLELQYELKQNYAVATTASKMMDLYQKAIIPQAELALQSAQSSYSVGTADFLSVITNFSTIHSYQLDYYRQLADYETALARIEALTGDLNDHSKERSNDK